MEICGVFEREELKVIKITFMNNYGGKRVEKEKKGELFINANYEKNWRYNLIYNLLFHIYISHLIL